MISLANVSIARLCQDLDGVRPFLCELRSSLVVTPNGKKTYVVTPSVDFFQEYGEFARQAIAERNQDPPLKARSDIARNFDKFTYRSVTTKTTPTLKTMLRIALI